MRSARTVLTIAGSDSGGGAGIQADLKTFAALGVHGASAITAITAQNTVGVIAVHPLPRQVVAEQIEAVVKDFDVAAIKIGMLASAAIVAAVAESLSRSENKPFVVYDSVLAASSGDSLARAGLIESLGLLLPLVDLLTPNLGEAAAILGEEPAVSESDMQRQGAALLARGPGAILMKGGHLAGEDCVDWLLTAGSAHRFAAPRSASYNLHGTGCALSSAIAARIALGDDVVAAIGAAKAFVTQAIRQGADVRLGAGPGPLIQIPLARPGSAPQTPKPDR